MNKLQDQFVQKLIESLKAEDGWEYYCDRNSLGIRKGKALASITLRMSEISWTSGFLWLEILSGNSTVKLSDKNLKTVIESVRPLFKKLQSQYQEAQQVPLLTKALSIL